jgi:hypothetical protein
MDGQMIWSLLMKHHVLSTNTAIVNPIENAFFIMRTPLVSPENKEGKNEGDNDNSNTQYTFHSRPRL